MQDLLTAADPRRGRTIEINGFLLHGMNILERGYIFTCMIIAAISAFLIDRRFYQAAWWSLAAGVLTFSASCTPTNSAATGWTSG